MYADTGQSDQTHSRVGACTDMRIPLDESSQMCRPLHDEKTTTLYLTGLPEDYRGAAVQDTPKPPTSYPTLETVRPAAGGYS